MEHDSGSKSKKSDRSQHGLSHNLEHSGSKTSLAEKIKMKFSLSKHKSDRDIELQTSDSSLESVKKNAKLIPLVDGKDISPETTQSLMEFFNSDPDTLKSKKDLDEGISQGHVPNAHHALLNDLTGPAGKKLPPPNHAVTYPASSHVPKEYHTLHTGTLLISRVPPKELVTFGTQTDPIINPALCTAPIDKTFDPAATPVLSDAEGIKQLNSNSLQKSSSAAVVLPIANVAVVDSLPIASTTATAPQFDSQVDAATKAQDSANQAAEKTRVHSMISQWNREAEQNIASARAAAAAERKRLGKPDLVKQSSHGSLSSLHTPPVGLSSSELPISSAGAGSVAASNPQSQVTAEKVPLQERRKTDDIILRLASAVETSAFTAISSDVLKKYSGTDFESVLQALQSVHFSEKRELVDKFNKVCAEAGSRLRALHERNKELVESQTKIQKENEDLKVELSGLKNKWQSSS